MRQQRRKKTPNSTSGPSLLRASRRLATLLEVADRKVVFAESCTAGLVSASLARIPGVSARHCGSAVTYRSETKNAWLNLSPQLLKRPGAVSEKAARQMAEGVLAITPEADISASVTGHLGPGAPKEQDGLIFVAVAHRSPRTKRPKVVNVRPIRLTAASRYARQREAALCVLVRLCEELQPRAS